MDNMELAKVIIEVTDEVRYLYRDDWSDNAAECGFLKGLTKLSERGWKLRKYINITTKACPVCDLDGEVITVPEDDYLRLNIMSIQYALPGLTTSQRERLITGMCDVCWDKLMGEDNEGTEK